MFLLRFPCFTSYCINLLYKVLTLMLISCSSFSVETSHLLTWSPSFLGKIERLSCFQLAGGSVYEFQLSYKTSTPLSWNMTESFHSELAPSWAPRRRQPPRHLCRESERVNLSTGGWHCIMISAGETGRPREIVLNVWIVSTHTEQQGGMWHK